MIRGVFPALVRVRRLGHVFVALRVRLRWVSHVVLLGHILQNADRQGRVRSAQIFVSDWLPPGEFATMFKRDRRIFM